MNEPRKVLLWRHGQTSYNLQGRAQGQVDIQLNESGIAQARATAQMIAQYRPDAIYCSDLGRARRTAEALASLVGIPVRVDTRFRERSFGNFEGLNAKEMQQQFPEEYEAWRRTGESEEAGIESRFEVGERFAAGVRDCFERLDTGQTMVVVSHGSAITQGAVTLLGLDPVQWQGLRGLDNAHFMVLVEAARVPGWRLAAHNLAPADLPGIAVPSRS